MIDPEQKKDFGCQTTILKNLKTCNEIEMKQETDRRENKDGKEVIFGLQHTDASLRDRELGPS